MPALRRWDCLGLRAIVVTCSAAKIGGDRLSLRLGVGVQASAPAGLVEGRASRMGLSRLHDH